jgi:hypothetical protein
MVVIQSFMKNPCGGWEVLPVLARYLPQETVAGTVRMHGARG